MFWKIQNKLLIINSSKEKNHESGNDAGKDMYYLWVVNGLFPVRQCVYGDGTDY